MRRTEHYVNAILNIDKRSKSDLARYLHACAYSPTKSTFLKAICSGHFTSWPGLTYDLINKHLIPTIATSKGHLRQEQQNIRSTQREPEPDDGAETLDYHPLSENDNTKTHECYLTYYTKDEGVTYLDPTGIYSTKSSRGNQYIIVCYDYDTNSIQARLTTSRNAADIRNATMSLLEKLTASGHPPKLHIMDNEASVILKAALLKHKIRYQLVPPHLHRRNSAERAIQTFKAHSIAGLCSTDPDYPAAEWDRLIPQAEITLNLLRSCRFNPKLSAHAALNGFFNFNATPLAPPGTKVLLHEKPDQRCSWAPRGADAWYTGPALEHYRCVECYMPETRSTRIADTVEYFPKQIPFPKSTTEDYLRQSISDILALLNDPKPPIAPFLPFGDETTNALRQIATLLNRVVPQPTPVEPLPETVPTTSETPTQTSAELPRVVVPDQAAPPHVPPPRVERPRRPRTVSPERTPPTTSTHVLNHMHHPLTGAKETFDTLRCDNPDRWNRSMANELGRLTSGVGERMKTGNENIFYIKKSQIPNGRKVTYANAVCDYRPLKDEPYRVRLTVGGDRLPYPADAGAPAATILEAKLLFNSVVSTH
jgi:hypothetical protein